MTATAEYRKLVNQFLPLPIQTQADYRRALTQVQKLMVPRPTRAQSMLIEVLSTLIENFESRQYATPSVTPDRMLAHCLESRGVTATQVAKDTGIPQATLSNVLARRRGISKANAIKLGDYFHLPTSAFI